MVTLLVAIKIHSIIYSFSCDMTFFSIFLQSLCVVERQQCWVLYVDVLILECGGNLYDAISIAVKAALFNVKLPGEHLYINYGIL